MSAYVVVQENITDQATFDAYRKETPATVAAFWRALHRAWRSTHRARG
jgi:hypothetical protein